jgi:hypothetical protein
MASIHNLQPMQTPDPVARHEMAVGEGGQAMDRRIGLQAGGLDAGGMSHSRMVLSSEPDASRLSGSAHSVANAAPSLRE